MATHDKPAGSAAAGSAWGAAPQDVPPSVERRKPTSKLLREKGSKIVPGDSNTGAGFPMVTERLEFDSPCTTATGLQVPPPSFDVDITISFQPWSAQEKRRPSANA